MVCDLSAVDLSPRSVGNRRLPPSTVRLADPMDGKVYALPVGMAEALGEGCLRLRHLPICDYPLFLTFGDFVGYTTV